VVGPPPAPSQLVRGKLFNDVEAPLVSTAGDRAFRRARVDGYNKIINRATFILRSHVFAAPRSELDVDGVHAWVGQGRTNAQFRWFVLSTINHWRRNEFESGGEGHMSGAKRRKILFGRAPPLFGSTSTISRFDERFRDGQYSLVTP